MFTVARKVFGSRNQRVLRRVSKYVHEMNELESFYEKFSSSDLTKETDVLKERLSGGESISNILLPAFALVREACKRTLHMRHFDVQLIGGIVLHEGKIVERGKHDELIELDGYYKRLCDMQSF